MTQPHIKECANIACTNTWEILKEADAEHEVCGLCEMEAQAQTQPASAESEGRWGNPEATHLTPKEFSEKLGHILKRRVVTLGIQATLMAATLDPRLHPDAGGKAPDGISPEVLGAARDMADYLGGSRAAPESNRNSIPHARTWDLNHAVHVMRDVAYAIEKFPGEMSPAAQKRALLDLLDLTWDAALVSREEGSLPLLNLMVAGRAEPDILTE